MAALHNGVAIFHTYFVCFKIKIIKKFDAIAPYEKYSGGNEIEFSFMMDDIRNNR